MTFFGSRDFYTLLQKKLDELPLLNGASFKKCICDMVSPVSNLLKSIVCRFTRKQATGQIAQRPGRIIHRIFQSESDTQERGLQEIYRCTSAQASDEAMECKIVGCSVKCFMVVCIQLSQLQCYELGGQGCG